MGFLDYIYLMIFGGTFIITLPILIISLKCTKDEVKKAAYKKTYTPFLAGSAAMLIFYVAFISVVNTALDLVNR